MTLPPKPKKPTRGPDVRAEVGDHLFFNHPEIGPHAGRVMASGADGCILKDIAGDKHRVLWKDVIGHKSHADVKYRVVDVGESGAIVEDGDGKRKFIAGYEPPNDQEAGEDPTDKDIARLRDHVMDATNPRRKTLTKSLSGGPVLFHR